MINSRKNRGFYYSISMFPYPSGRLHTGHFRNFVAQDIYNRYLMLNGYDVKSYLGWDAFGLPAEKAALDSGCKPSEWTYSNIREMNEVSKQFGNYYESNNFDNQLITCDKTYYNFQRKIFLKLYKAGLIYAKSSYVNWDPKLQTVLANEQVDANGMSWRSGVKAERKKLTQWFCGITQYADELLSALSSLDWPKRIVNAQISWIGKSQGYTFEFPIVNSDKCIEIFTTQPQTISGCTFIAISKESDYVDWFDVKDGKVGECIYDGRRIPVYVADYVLDYGTGAVMGVPNADERDAKFAKDNGISVLDYEYETKDEFVGNNGLQPVTQYKLKDWCISRQRSWGCPIPIIYCDKCGVIEDNENIELPTNLDFTKNGNPLNHCDEFVNVKCPKCNGDARRETDTMDTFFDSSWYYLRYLNQNDNKQAFNKYICKPVDLYVGGAEHATLHLLYARFITKALRDLGLLEFDEPFIKLINQGMVLAKAFTDKNGLPVYSDEVAERDGKYYNIYTKEEVNYIGIQKMSKSLKNVADPKEIIKDYGLDACRLFVASEPIEVEMEWNVVYLNGSNKFINRIHRFHEAIKEVAFTGFDNDLFAEAHELINNYIIEMNQFKTNCAVAKMRSLLNILEDRIKSGKFSFTLRWAFGRFLVNMAPILVNTCGPIYESIFKKDIWNLDYYTDEWMITKNYSTIKVFINNKHMCDMENSISEDDLIKQVMSKYGINEYKNKIFIENKMIKLII
jgi:leucyl-tRNA synthetase